MTPLPGPPSQSTTRAARGFTLLEMVVSLVVVGILASIGVATYHQHIVGVRDRGARNVVLQVAADSQGLAAGSAVKKFTYASLVRAVRGLPASLAGDGAGTAFTLIPDGPATRWGEVSVTLTENGTATQLGIATLSQTGHCITATVPLSGSPIVTIDQSPAAGSCNGSGAMPDPPTAPSVNCTVHDQSVVVNWTSAGSGTDPIAYVVVVDGDDLLTVGAGSRTATARKLSNGTEYNLVVQALDAYDQRSSATAGEAGCTATPTDDAAPDMPVSLTGTGGERQAILSWSASTPADLAGYQVLRDTNLVASIPVGTLAYVDTGADAGGLAPGLYEYTVQALDVSGNVSASSSPVTVTVTDTTAPPTPTPSVTAAVRAITVSWPAVNPVDGDLAGYRVYRCAGSSCIQASLVVDLADVATVSWENTPIADGTFYKYWVSAYDSSGNESSRGGPAGTSTVKIPDVPRVTVTATGTTATWNWSVPSGTTRFETNGYATATGTTPDAADSGDPDTGYTTLTASTLTAASAYTLSVRACSPAGCSALTTVEALTLPAEPTPITATSNLVRQVSLAWTRPAGTIARYAVYRATTNSIDAATKVTTVGTPDTVEYVDSGLGNGITYYYWVRATNATGPGAWPGSISAITKALPSQVSFADSECPIGFGDVFSGTSPDRCNLVLAATGASSWSIQASGPLAWSEAFQTNRTPTGPVPYAGDQDQVLTLAGSACNEAGCTDVSRRMSAVPQPLTPDIVTSNCGFSYCVFEFSATHATTYEVNIRTRTESTTVTCPETGVYCSGDAFGESSNGTVTLTGATTHGFHLTTRCPVSADSNSGCTRSIYVQLGASSATASAVRVAGTAQVWWSPVGWCLPAGVDLAPDPASCAFSNYVASY